MSKTLLLRWFPAVVLFSFAAGALPQAKNAGQNAPGGGQRQGGAEPAKKPKRQRVVADLSGFDLLDPGKVKKQSTIVGATRGFPPPTTYAPRLGKVYDRQPFFAWRYEGRAQRFNFVVLDDGQNELFRAEVKGSQYRYPTEAPALAPGKTYFWTVEAAGVLMGGGPAPLVGMIVLSAEQRAELDKALEKAGTTDAYRTALGRAKVFTDFRLWYDAVAAYNDLIAQYPDRAELYEGRGMIYAQLSVTQSLADRDFAKSDELLAPAKTR